MSETAGVVSGHYAGFFSRAVAFVLDWFIITALFGLMVAGVGAVIGPLLGVSYDPETIDPVLWAVLFGSWVFVYSVVGLTLVGRTLGKTLGGLRVVTREGEPISGWTAVVRVVTLPLSFALFGLGLIGVVVGKERRALHDVLAGTAVVYDWGDRPAAMPAPLTHYLQRKGVMAGTEADAAGDEAAAERTVPTQPAP